MPIAPTYAEGTQIQEFAAWFARRVEECGISKRALAKALGHDSTQHLNKFIRGLALPMPDTLRVLCSEMGLSWPAAFARAGFYGELLWVLADLNALGQKWLLADGAEPVDPLQFRSLGTTSIRSEPVWVALEKQKYASRYQVGCYHPKVSDETQAAQIRPIYCAIPKPMAVAILVAVTGWPRRGDVWRDGASTYAADVLEQSAQFINIASENTGVKSLLPGLLAKAFSVLRDKDLSLNTRRVIMSEFINDWADSICAPYTWYARIAALAFWGEAGSSETSMTPFSFMPQMMTAQLPEIIDLVKI